MGNAAYMRTKDHLARGGIVRPPRRPTTREIDQDIRAHAQRYWNSVYAQPIIPPATIEDEALHSLELARIHGHLDRDGIPIRLLQPRLSPRYVWT